ncbi:hypothetical protein TSMEX_000844, partial [Taenia solium]
PGSLPNRPYCRPCSVVSCGVLRSPRGSSPMQPWVNPSQIPLSLHVLALSPPSWVWSSSRKSRASATSSFWVWQCVSLSLASSSTLSLGSI